MRLWPFGRRKKPGRRAVPAEKQKATAPTRETQKNNTSPGTPGNIPVEYEAALRLFKDRMRHSDDFMARQIVLGDPPGVQAALLYVQGISSKEHQSEMILQDTMLRARMADPHIRGNGKEILDLLEKRYVAFAEVKRQERFDEAVDSILSGESVLIIDGAPEALVLDTKGWAKRGIEEPATEAVIRGPRDGFIETFRVNIATIRRRLRTPDLAVEQMKIGQRTKTDIAILYLVDAADPEVVSEIRKRLTGVEVDGVIETGHLEQILSDNPFTLFPVLERTERPDKVVASILEGRVAMVVDNTPFVLLAPTTATLFFQASEDYYENPILQSALRLLRIGGFLVAMLATAVYVAAVDYHQELIPFTLLLRIVGTHEGLPFQTLPTALLMEAVIEVLREAGVRLPRPVGSAVSIVGALIIGEAAVAAGFVPPGMVIVVAFSTIAGFMVPGFGLTPAFRVLRFPLILAAGTFGLFGLGVTGMIVLFHVCSLSSFGTPYLGPLSPQKLHEFWDKPVVTPIPYRSSRRPSWAKGDLYRQAKRAGNPPAPRLERDKKDDSEGTEGDVDNNEKERGK